MAEPIIRWYFPGGFKGPQGERGEKGWSPILALVEDGDRVVQQVVDWTGGSGAKPSTGQYIGEDWLVSAIEDAVDVRGPQGPQGIAGPIGETGPAGPQGEKGDTGGGIPEGGDPGQIAAKASATNFDTQWTYAGLDGAPVVIKIGDNFYRLTGVIGDNGAAHPYLEPFTP